MTRERDSLERLCRRARAHEEPSAADRAFVREQLAARIAAVGLAAATAASAGKAAAASGAPALGAVGSGTVAGASALKGGLAGVAAWVAGGASVTAGAVLLVHSFGAVPDRSPAVVPPTVAVVALSATPRIASPRTPPVAAKTRAPAPVPISTPTDVAPEATPKRSLAPPAIPASAKPSLADEARGLARVQRALRDGDATTAIGLLDEQDRRFRGGSLAAERAAARALAGCAAGRGQARAQAERFVAQHAGSPLAERVQRKCLGSR